MWNEVKLGEVCDLQNGFAFKSSDWSYTGKPIIRIQNLTNSSNNINKTKVRVDSKYFIAEIFKIEKKNRSIDDPEVQEALKDQLNFYQMATW